MALYEHIYIARQDVSPAQVDLLTEELQGILKENGGTVEKAEYWGLRNLQYKIKKNRKGHYSLMHINAPHEAVAEMERQMRLKEDILRFMTIRVEELDPEPSPVMSRRDRDDRRDDRGGDRRDRGDRGDRGDRR
ncbi:MAG: 30S ribosomal protein S6 [Parvularculaceae bacterium]|nr:30S ribosomal protein S6 [Parvularculaceae bacterium]